MEKNWGDTPSATLTSLSRMLTLQFADPKVDRIVYVVFSHVCNVNLSFQQTLEIENGAINNKQSLYPPP